MIRENGNLKRENWKAKEMSKFLKRDELEDKPVDKKGGLITYQILKKFRLEAYKNKGVLLWDNRKKMQ